jgi:secreted trypsin-like serine protease
MCDSSTGLVFGGTAAKANEFPHMAAIGHIDALTSRFKSHCGGSLISENAVLTAAHCRSKNAKIVRMGVLNITTPQEDSDYLISQFIIHENYDSFKKKNDIAIVKLARSVDFKNNKLNIKPACLHIDSDVPETATVSGWGAVENAATSDILLRVKLNIVKIDECSQNYNDELGETQICAGGENGKDSCFGDSGSPLQTFVSECTQSIFGIVSFGPNFGCGFQNIPGVYTKVSSYIDWIENKVWRN